jgi:hypothetical protein
MRTTKCSIAVLILGLMLVAGTAGRASADDQLSNLTAQWWQFVFSIPTGVNPLLDTTGADCVIGQRGPVWFLGGTFSGGSAMRTCFVPEGEQLFFPVVNQVFFNTPNCGQNGVNFTANQLRRQAAAIVDSATNLSVSVDGVAVNNVARVKSVVFAVTVPADNIFGPNACAQGVSLAAGSYSPSVDDGYYVLLAPLSVGKHTLHISGQLPTVGVTVDVTYDLTIVPVVLK